MLQFKKKTDELIARKEQIQRDAREASDAAIGHAQNCLRDESFNKYREAYELTERLVIEELILLDQIETDPVRYGFQCKDIISKLRHIGSLLRAVKSDAGKKI